LAWLQFGRCRVTTAALATVCRVFSRYQLNRCSTFSYNIKHNNNNSSIQTEPNPLNWAAYDEVIDVRTPSEFADDHLPGAVNLPLLGDGDRAAIGKTFARSPFDGRRLGASVISQRIGELLGTHFADKSVDFRPLIYCWRGGQRSHSLAIVLSQIGYQPTVLAGGYRAYRRVVVKSLNDLAGVEPPVGRLKRAVVLAGLTGSGKTYLLERLARQGEQVVDLESLANHRGSLLGSDPNRPDQPSQKSFESSLFRTLSQLDADKPVWLECESARIGYRSLPQSLVATLARSPRILLEAESADDRVKHLIEQYGSLVERTELLIERLNLLGRHHSKSTQANWLAAAAAGDIPKLVHLLLTDHYDPLYRHSRRRYFLETDSRRVIRLALNCNTIHSDEILVQLKQARDSLLFDNEPSGRVAVNCI
uniref:Rhodanese domain-containing protein n=2 Tax=Macrostomum lignano TaxID=282301 RepID=A0A1I8J182_9PLAT